MDERLSVLAQGAELCELNLCQRSFGWTKFFDGSKVKAMKRFDFILWRINGVFLLLAICAGIMLMSWGFFQILGESSRAQKNAAVVNVDQNTHKKEYLHLGNTFEIKGSTIVRMPLYIDSSAREFSSGSYSGGRVRNYLFVNYANMSSKWLFDDFKRLIPNKNDFNATLTKRDSAIVGTIYQIVASDTNGDGQVNEDDKISIVFGSPDGQNLSEIIPSVDRVLSIDQVTDSEALIIYQQAQSTSALLVSTATGKKVLESMLPLK